LRGRGMGYECGLLARGLQACTYAMRKKNRANIRSKRELMMSNGEKLERSKSLVMKLGFVALAV
jgi:hypothetical protein